MGGPLDNVKADDATNSGALGNAGTLNWTQNLISSIVNFLEVDSKQSRLSGNFNANPVLTGNTII
jgi:hypothetical protein